jgi:isoquinoline 1-oxidoreductase subunit alpha
MGSMSTTFKLNGRQVSVDALPETPLLWIIREALKLPGTRFGLRRGTMHVHIDGDRGQIP